MKHLKDKREGCYKLIYSLPNYPTFPNFGEPSDFLQTLSWLWWILQVPFLILSIHCVSETESMIHLKTTCRFTKPSLTSPFLLIHQLSFFSLKPTVHLLVINPCYPCTLSSLTRLKPRSVKPLTSDPTCRPGVSSGGFQNHVEVLLVQPLPDFNASWQSSAPTQLSATTSFTYFKEKKYRPLGTNLISDFTSGIFTCIHIFPNLLFPDLRGKAASTLFTFYPQMDFILFYILCNPLFHDINFSLPLGLETQESRNTVKSLQSFKKTKTKNKNSLDDKFARVFGLLFLLSHNKLLRRVV